MSWTWDIEKEGNYDEYNVSLHFDQAKRVVYSKPEWSFDEKQHFYIYFNNAVLYDNFMFLFSDRVAQLHPRHYLKQQEYIKGTYIRKDRFQAALLKNVLKEVDEFIDFNYKPLNDYLWIRIDEWNTYKEWVHNQIGIPKEYQ